jgi:hypothetical protein
MGSNIDDSSCQFESRADPASSMAPFAEDNTKLSRWLVSFASGKNWYSVGEFFALDAAAAIARAIEIFGSASDYRAEEIPWDAAPLPKPRTTNGAVTRTGSHASGD